jgi:NADPH:quinone reductase-like Zn-dependent oxidoreductase
MKAIVLTKLGGVDVLNVQNVSQPSIETPHDVLIKLEFSGTNFAETLARRGLKEGIYPRNGRIWNCKRSGK